MPKLKDKEKILKQTTVRVDKETLKNLKFVAAGKPIARLLRELAGVLAAQKREVLFNALCKYLGEMPGDTPEDEERFIDLASALLTAAFASEQNLDYARASALAAEGIEQLDIPNIPDELKQKLIDALLQKSINYKTREAERNTPEYRAKLVKVSQMPATKKLMERYGWTMEDLGKL